MSDGPRRAWSLTAAVVLLGVGAATPGENVRILVAAYRGGKDLWPENSLRALRGARTLNVDYVQLDVHMSRAGEVVVIHDATLDRTTTGWDP